MLSEATHPDQLPRALTAFASSVEGTSLYLLRAIDVTVDNLGIVEALARATSNAASSLMDGVSKLEVVSGEFLDPDDVAINSLEAAYRSLEEALPDLLVKKNAVDQDDQLNDHHCELLHGAYDGCITAVAELIEATKDLRAAVIRHDLAAERPIKETFGSAGDLIASLRSS